ncbi:MAG: DUF1538 domain-containing protein [Clostridia bacterium]|nr:DUF1538 domain-containing protein [Clostridia bacterium]
MKQIIKAKLLESLQSIWPIAAVVAILSITISPMEPGTFLLFLIGVFCLIIGLSIFTIGAELSMQPLGSKLGSTLASSGKVWLIALVSLVIGIMVTISEPDLQILAKQVSRDIPELALILAVSVGVGIFLVIAMLRMIFHISLNKLLIVFYAIVFVLCFFVPKDFWAMAFDSGGVTTGPMTVPFIMAIGAGVSSMRTDKDGHDDAFGLVALCSVGPIIAVMVLGIICGVSGGEHVAELLPQIADTRSGILHYAAGIGEYAKEVGIALLPLAVFALLFQLVTHAFSARRLIRILIGLVYTFVGLVIFLTGANEGFLPTGSALGQSLADLGSGWAILPIGMIFGYFIVSAEPAVYVLNKQVEQITAGAISSRTMSIALSIGVSAALGLSMLRILTGISILWILIPGYIIALGLSFFVPKFFTGIAFDSGGVASGVMMSAFVLPFAQGACIELGGNVLTQAFGCVAFVALTPIISIQVCGLVYNLKSRSAVKRLISEQEVFLDYSVVKKPKRTTKAKEEVL